MLEIALAPTAVPHGDVGKGGGAFLIRPHKAGDHMDGPAATAHQSGLDEVVTKDVPTKGGLAAQMGEASLLGKGLSADNGVMAPIIAF